MTVEIHQMVPLRSPDGKLPQEGLVCLVLGEPTRCAYCHELLPSKEEVALVSVDLSLVHPDGSTLPLSQSTYAALCLSCLEELAYK